MRLTVLKQQSKSVGAENEKVAEEAEKLLEKIKHYLWYGNAHQALKKIDWLIMDLESVEARNAAVKKLLAGVEDFRTYVENNRGFIPNFGERYRNGETISTAFVESTVNWVVSKRMVKKQQMQWTKRGAHLLLQVRTRVLNGEWEDVLRSWYPGFRAQVTPAPSTAAPAA